MCVQIGGCILRYSMISIKQQVLRYTYMHALRHLFQQVINCIAEYREYYALVTFILLRSCAVSACSLPIWYITWRWYSNYAIEPFFFRLYVEGFTENFLNDTHYEHRYFFYVCLFLNNVMIQRYQNMIVVFLDSQESSSMVINWKINVIDYVSYRE